METTKLIQLVNDLTDETYPDSQVTAWLNDAISRINAEANANFPFLDHTVQNDATVIPEKWARLLLVPFASARVKQVDSSQFEYTDLFGEFEYNLNLFKTKYVVPEEYQDTEDESGSVASDIYTAPPSPDWSW